MENKIIDITKENVKEYLKNQTYKIVYPAVFKQANWVVGTKTDPKKEFGTIGLSVIVPKDDGTYYTKDIDCFLSDKEQLPKGKLEPFSNVDVIFEFNKYNPSIAGRFVKIIE